MRLSCSFCSPAKSLEFHSIHSASHPVTCQSLRWLDVHTAGTRSGYAAVGRWCLTTGFIQSHSRVVVCSKKALCPLFQIVCYIYFTRIIAILLRVTMPFQWQWCYEVKHTMLSIIFIMYLFMNYCNYIYDIQINFPRHRGLLSTACIPKQRLSWRTGRAEVN